MSNPFPFGTGKLFGSYLFLGSCLSILIVSNLAGIEDLDARDLIFLIITVGSIIGSVLSTFQIHKISSLIYIKSQIREILNTDYKSFEEQRYTFYYRFIIAFSGFLLIFLIFTNSDVESSVNVILNQLFAIAGIEQGFQSILIIFTFFSIANWLYSTYSNRKALLLLMYVTKTSRACGGIPQSGSSVQKLDKELREGNWEEAKSQFLAILMLLTELFSHSTNQNLFNDIFENEKIINLKKIGITGIDPKIDGKQISDIVNLVEHHSFKESIVEDQLQMFYEILIDFLNEKSWKVTDWEKFISYNLPIWLKIDVQVSKITLKMKSYNTGILQLIKNKANKDY